MYLFFLFVDFCIVSLLNASSKTGSRISSRSSDLSQSGTYSFPSRSSGQFQQKKKKSVGIVHLSDDDVSFDILFDC